MNRAIKQSRSREESRWNSSQLQTLLSKHNSNSRLEEAKVSLESISIKLDGCLLKDRRIHNNQPSSAGSSLRKNAVLGATIRDLLPDENSRKSGNNGSCKSIVKPNGKSASKKVQDDECKRENAEPE